MAASDHLSPLQDAARYFHGSNAEFKPGDVLSREGAFRAKHPEAAKRIDANTSASGWNSGPTYGWKTNDDNHPIEDHLYYGDQSLLKSGESAGYGKNLYEVEHVTKAGRPSNSHKPDPNYTNEGLTGAFRTTNRLRVVGKVDQQGNRL